MRPVHALFVALFLTGACESEREVPRSLPATPAFKPDRLEHDFGRVPIDGGTVETLFRLVNESSDDVQLASVATSCGCTSATAQFADGSTVGSFDPPADGDWGSAGRSVMAGESFQVRVVFDPAAHGPDGVGELMREVILATPDGSSTRLVIMVNVVQG